MVFQLEQFVIPFVWMRILATAMGAIIRPVDHPGMLRRYICEMPTEMERCPDGFFPDQRPLVAWQEENGNPLMRYRDSEWYVADASPQGMEMIKLLVIIKALEGVEVTLPEPLNDAELIALTDNGRNIVVYLSTEQGERVLYIKQRNRSCIPSPITVHTVIKLENVSDPMLLAAVLLQCK